MIRSRFVIASGRRPRGNPYSPGFVSRPRARGTFVISDKSTQKRRLETLFLRTSLALPASADLPPYPARSRIVVARRMKCNPSLRLQSLSLRCALGGECRRFRVCRGKRIPTTSLRTGLGMTEYDTLLPCHCERPQAARQSVLSQAFPLRGRWHGEAVPDEVSLRGAQRRGNPYSPRGRGVSASVAGNGFPRRRALPASSE